MTRVAAVVLAAGGSSRMGRPKQLLLFRGQSLLRKAADTGLRSGCDPVVIVLGANAEQLQSELMGMPVMVADNPSWQQGPGTSVRVGLAMAATADAIVFLTCDQPFVDASHVRDLIAIHETTGRPMAASGYGQSVGMPALFARQCFAELGDIAPEAGAKQVLTRHPDLVAVVPFPAGEIDLDTPADYARWITE